MNKASQIEITASSATVHIWYGFRVTHRPYGLDKKKGQTEKES
jgi:hypothetical protein